ncbi:hypothetical protein F4679DRAFT_199980 [Xylaria curta]|nr:hypothetical protein F4679DRAFT_199980 [Xylaria curta]
MAESCKNEHEPSQIAILVSQTIDSIKALLSSLDPHGDHYAKAASQLARFKLWAGSIEANERFGRRSLDYRLRDASSVRQHVIGLLDQLRQTIKDALSPSSHSEIPLGETHGLLNPELMKFLMDDDEPIQSNLDIALDDISHVVDCMLRLSVTIMNPAPHDQFMSRAGLETMAHFEQYDIAHVKEKFTLIEDKLAARLGAAITARRHFFKYREGYYATLSSGVDHDDSLTENSDQTTHASSRHTQIEDGIFEDPSVVSATSYGPSLHNVDELRVPPIPKEHIARPLLCPFCYLTIKIDSREDWKKHVFRDLQPYVCVASSCSA